MIRRRGLDAACLALLMLIAAATGHLILTTALTAGETLAQAEARKGM
ncbi:MAG: hypothetical protein V4720_06370 [Pseudomonadota bacterium]